MSFDWMDYALRVAKTTYGVDLDVYGKGKQLTKFGRTTNADAGIKTTVAEFQGSEANETFATANTVDSIVSSSASDTGKTIGIEGHTINTTTGDRTFVVQSAVLNGQTPVTLETSMFRMTRMYVADGTYSSPASEVVGTVYGYDSTLAGGVTAGVPNTASSTKCLINAPDGFQQSQKAATSLSSVDYWILTYVRAGMVRPTGTSIGVDVDLEVRNLGGVWRPEGLQLSLENTATTFYKVEFHPFRIVPANSDVRIICTSDTNNVQVQASVGGVLAKVAG